MSYPPPIRYRRWMRVVLTFASTIALCTCGTSNEHAAPQPATSASPTVESSAGAHPTYRAVEAESTVCAATLGEYEEIAPTTIPADSADGHARAEALQQRLQAVVREIDSGMCVTAIESIEWVSNYAADLLFTVVSDGHALRVPIRFFVERDARQPPRHGDAGLRPNDWRPGELGSAIQQETRYQEFRSWMASDPRILWVVSNKLVHDGPWFTVMSWQDGADKRACVFVEDATHCFSTSQLGLTAKLTEIGDPSNGDNWAPAVVSNRSALDLRSGRIASVSQRRRTTRGSWNQGGSWNQLSEAEVPESMRGWDGLPVGTRAEGVVEIDDAFECVQTGGGWACNHRTPPAPGPFPFFETAAVRSLSLSDELTLVLYTSRDGNQGVDSEHYSLTYAIVYATEDNSLRSTATLPVGASQSVSRNIGDGDPIRSVVETGWSHDLSIEQDCIRLIRLQRQRARPRRPPLRHYRWRDPQFERAPANLDLDATDGLASDEFNILGEERPLAPDLEGFWTFEPSRGFERVASSADCQ